MFQKRDISKDRRPYVKEFGALKEYSGFHKTVISATRFCEQLLTKIRVFIIEMTEVVKGGIGRKTETYENYPSRKQA